MGKILVEICLMSARGLRAGIGSFLLKPQWYAVGWINPEDKYCTTIDASTSENPVWGTKFATLLDEDSELQNSKSVLQVEIYSRDPIFLRKKLHGSATISLKQVFAKFKQQSSSKSVIIETGSFQLRKMKSNKPRGLVDVSVRLSPEREDLGKFTGDTGGVMLSNNSDYNTSGGQNYMASSSSHHPFDPLSHSNNSNPFSVPPYSHHSSMPNPPMPQQPYYPPPMQPPPPPPSNASYMPSYIPRSENAMNIPSSSSSGGGYARPGLGMGAGAVVGAAAAYYGSEFLSGGIDLPSSLPLPNVSISIDPPF